MDGSAEVTDRSARQETARLETRDRILVEAERLFRHYGYTKTTVADIAKALGMSPANVYRFFNSKAEINEAIAEKILGAKEAMALSFARAPLPASERLRQIVLAAHHGTIDTLIGETKVHEMVVVAMDEQWSTIQAHIQRMTDILAVIVADGIEAGEFRPQDPLLAARCAHQCFSSLVHPQLVVQCRRDPENYANAEQMVDFVLSALKA